MKSTTENLAKIISKESAKLSENKKIKEFERLLADLKKTGLIEKPDYNLPLVDTIGKIYYSSIIKY